MKFMVMKDSIEGKCIINIHFVHPFKTKFSIFDFVVHISENICN